MQIRASDFDVQTKCDGSPVSKADREAEAVIVSGLARHRVRYPVIAEEAVSTGRMPVDGASTFILVDALDGTREFVGGRDGFTVNVALVEQGVPTVGVVGVPATGEIFSGSAEGAFRNGKPIACRPERPPRVTLSRSHPNKATADWIGRLGSVYDLAAPVRVGSSLKFCRLAQGAADVYPRLGPTMWWDTAAGDAVLRAAGGMTYRYDPDRSNTQTMSYGPTSARGFSNPDFVAVADPSFSILL